jgi:hypothetical protein
VHPLWEHFESFHINMVPSYETQYEPAPSLFMAAGIILGKSPWWGVWIATGLMCAAICWALQPVLTPTFAFLAGLFCAFKYSIGTNYSDSYWGGSVCALGGAIALGAFIRVLTTRSPKWVPVLVVGVAMLANSRPYEGFLFSVPFAIGLLIWCARQRMFFPILVPAAASLAVVVAAMAYYNFRGTGNPTEMPYTANMQQYHFVRPFIGTGETSFPHYHHAVMAAMYRTWEGQPGKLEQSWKGIRRIENTKWRFYDKEHFAPLFLLALLGCVYGFRSRLKRYLSYTFLIVLIGLFAVVWWPLSSYPAPLLVSYFGLAFLGIRVLGTAKLRGYRLGRYWARGLAAVVLIVPLIGIPHLVRKSRKLPYPLPWNLDRERISKQLEDQGGKHVLLVHYAEQHIPHEEWVYNSPDIDRQQVIFARAMGADEDCDVVHYYPDRKIWFLDVDDQPWARLRPADSLVSYCNASPLLRTQLILPGEFIEQQGE